MKILTISPKNVPGLDMYISMKEILMYFYRHFISRSWLGYCVRSEECNSHLIVPFFLR